MYRFMTCTIIEVHKDNKGLDMSSEISIHNFTVHGYCILLLYLILDGRAEEELLADLLCVFRRLDLMTDCSGVYKDFIIVSSLFEKDYFYKTA